MHNSSNVTVTLEKVRPRPRARFAVAACLIASGAAVVGVVRLTDTPSAAVAPQCAAGQLRLAPTFYGVAAGQFIQTLTFTNVSAHACRISGWPSIVGVETRRVVQGPEGARPFKTVTLRPHAAASFDVFGADWDNRTNRPCPRTKALVVTPPGSSDRIRVFAKVPNCPGGLEVAPLIAGRTDRDAWSFVWHR
jgi:Protein of unknown function (DUF4232)